MRAQLEDLEQKINQHSERLVTFTDNLEYNKWNTLLWEKVEIL